MWWKMFRQQRAVIDGASAGEVGAGLMGAFAYFDGVVVKPVDLRQEAFLVFCVMRPYIDESKADYEKAVENGRKGGRPKVQRADENEGDGPF